jgi:hypothetical protein
LFACNPEELFNTKKAPEAGSIQTDASNFTVNPTDTVKFWINATNPEEGQLSYEWAIKDDGGDNAGDFIGSNKTDTLIWKAPIVGGIYEVKVTISNNDESITRTEQIRVVTLVAPLVTILSPNDGAYIVQYQNTKVKAEVIHPLGIYQTELIVNDTLHVAISSGNGDDIYEFNWQANVPSGKAEVKIMAEANVTGAVGADSVVINIEGIIPGKK